MTFGTLKPGLLTDPGSGHAGVVELVDIGLGPYLDPPPDASAPQAADIAELLPRPTAESDKYRRGVLGLLAGSDKYTGAALLATGGAVNGGAGMVRLVTAANAAAAVRLVHPEVMITELPGETTDRSKESGSSPAERKFQFPDDVGRVQAWVAGPGMGTDAAALDRLAADTRDQPPGAHRRGRARAARQPPGPAPAGRADAADARMRASWAACCGRIRPTWRPGGSSTRGARRTEFGACVLLKGSTTVVAPPHNLDPVLINTTGSSWLATAGTGDVLSGLAGALLAQGLAAPQAARRRRLPARPRRPDRGRQRDRGRPGSHGGEAPIGASDVVAALHAAFLAVAGGGGN